MKIYLVSVIVGIDTRPLKAFVFDIQARKFVEKAQEKKAEYWYDKEEDVLRDISYYQKFDPLFNGEGEQYIYTEIELEV